MPSPCPRRKSNNNNCYCYYYCGLDLRILVSSERAGQRRNRQGALKAKNKGHWTTPLTETAERPGPPCSVWALHLPAVDHYGPSFWGVEELDLADKAQEAGGVAGDAVVGPAGEVEEPQLPDLVVAFLRREGASVPPAAGSASPQWGHKKTTATRKRERCEKSSEGCRVFGDGASHRVTGLLWSLDPVGYRHIKLFFFFNHYPQPGNRLGASPCQNSQVEEARQPYR